MLTKYYLVYYEWATREINKLSYKYPNPEGNTFASATFVILTIPFWLFILALWLLPLSSSVQLAVTLLVILVFMVILPLRTAYILQSKKKIS
jgi:hypothetical protein